MLATTYLYFLTYYFPLALTVFTSGHGNFLMVPRSHVDIYGLTFPVCVCVCVCACMRACVHACMRACVHACMRACVRVVKHIFKVNVHRYLCHSEHCSMMHRSVI